MQSHSNPDPDTQALILVQNPRGRARAVLCGVRFEAGGVALSPIGYMTVTAGAVTYQSGAPCMQHAPALSRPVRVLTTASCRERSISRDSIVRYLSALRPAAGSSLESTTRDEQWRDLYDCCKLSPD